MVRARTLALALLACASFVQHAASETLLVEFTSPDCGPCREMRPVLDRLVAERVDVREVDVSQQPDVARQYGVTRWPTFIVLVDGQERARLVGKTSQAQLVEMIQKSEAIAAAKNSVATPVSNEAGPQTFAAGPSSVPLGDRIVQIEDPTPRRPADATRNPFGSASTAAEPPAAAVPARNDAPANAPNDAALIASTVRLSIEDPDGKSTGTGSIVDSRGGKALVLTCGHLFRSSAGKGAIQISLFTAGPAGAELLRTVPGEMVDYDLERDLALVCFLVDAPVNVMPIAPMGTALAKGSPVTSVGCNHGADPTVQQSHITAVDRYQLPPNLSVAGQPVEGRSGGGLFNAGGQLIGVCNAADPQGNEGLYASLGSIHAKLDEVGLSKVYLTPASGSPKSVQPPSVDPQPNPVENQVASQAIEQPLVRGQNPTPLAAPTFPATWPGPARNDEATTTAPESPEPATAPELAMASTPGASVRAEPQLTPQEQAALDEIRRRGADSEVICIIRPRTVDGRSDVIKLNNASPAFVEALAKSAQAAPTAAPNANLLR